MINRLHVRFSPSLILMLLGFFFCTLLPVRAQIGINLSLSRKEYLCYENIEAEVKITNQTAESIKLEDSKDQKPWLDFYLITKDDYEIKRSQRKWIPPTVHLNPGEVKTITVNFQPYFLFNESGTYLVSAELNFAGKTISTRSVEFILVQGVNIWKQTFFPKFSDGKSEQRVYSLHAHRLKGQNSLYARIENTDLQQVYATVNLGPVVSYGDPECKIDSNGDFFILHQSGTRNFTFHHFSPEGKRLKIRYFSNISSTPKLIKNEKNETLVIGGEEIFEKDEKAEKLTPPESKRP